MKITLAIRMLTSAGTRRTAPTTDNCPPQPSATEPPPQPPAPSHSAAATGLSHAVTQGITRSIASHATDHTLSHLPHWWTALKEWLPHPWNH